MESKQTNKTKPTPVELAEQAMQDMKTRIDLLRSHKSTVNRLIQTATDKPIFLLRNVEIEEALLRRTRTALNLWIQAQRSGKNHVDPEYCEVFKTSKEVDRLTGVQRLDGRGEDVVEKHASLQGSKDQDDEIRMDFESDVEQYLRCESSHRESIREEAEDWVDVFWDYETIPLEERFDFLVRATKYTDCDEYYCWSSCWSDGTAIPNV